MWCELLQRVLHEDVFYFFFILLSCWFCKGVWRVFSVKYILRSNNSPFSNSLLTVLRKRDCLAIIPLYEGHTDIFTSLKHSLLSFLERGLLIWRSGVLSNPVNSDYFPICFENPRIPGHVCFVCISAFLELQCNPVGFLPDLSQSDRVHDMPNLCPQ